MKLLKRISFFMLCFVSLFGFFNIDVYGYETEYSYIEERYDDGSYIEVCISYSCLNRTTTTKSKTATYKSESGKSMWSLTVKGTFNYNGSTSTCTSSSVTTNNYSSSWKLSNAKSSKSGSTANASVVAKLYHQDGTVLKTVNKTVKLTCDKNGNFS